LEFSTGLLKNDGLEADATKGFSFTSTYLRVFPNKSSDS
jgi:hypothetical protein